MLIRGLIVENPLYTILLLIRDFEFNDITKKYFKHYETQISTFYYIYIYIDVTSHGTLEFLAIKKIRTSSIPNHKNLPLKASLDATVEYTICRIEAISIYNRLESVSEKDKNHNALFLMLYI